VADTAAHAHIAAPAPQRVRAVNGVHIWYAVFGHGAPVILLHGGLANSSYWGLQVPALAKHYQVVVMDSRGHGRSTRDDRPYGYDLMADDVVGLLDFLKIHRAAVVGWSDGGILGLDLAIRHPDRVSKVFAFAANTDPSGVVAAAIPGAGLLIQPNVSHFSFLQDPEQFTSDVLHFLAQTP